MKIFFNWEYFVESLKRLIFGFEDYLFEKKNGYEFGGIVFQKDLVVNYKDSQSHATAYHAVWCRNLRELFSESSRAGYAFENFDDLGSGMGKACFYAASRKTFKNIIGVEFSTPLIDIANKNRLKKKLPNISFINADAAEFILPDQDNLIFMFNPFDAVILEKFISKNMEHFNNRNSIIAYANDVQRDCLVKLGFKIIFRNTLRKISLYQHQSKYR